MTNETHRISTVVDGVRFPHLKAFIEWGVDMQLADIRDLLRLPLPAAALTSGQNFASASAITSFMAGASVWFYDASEEGLRDRRDRARRFRDVIQNYWPWQGESVERAEVVKVLWDYARNPLAHSLGLPGPADGVVISIRKSPLTVEQLVELETSEQRPEWIGATIASAESGLPGAAYFLSVPALYWGLHRLLGQLLSDDDQATQAEELAAALVRYLTHGPWRRPT